MRTLGFSTLSVEVGEDSRVVLLYVKAPGEPPITIEMSADEVMVLLVEFGNALSTSRNHELTQRIQWTKEYEEGRRSDIREDSSGEFGGDYTEESD